MFVLIGLSNLPITSKLLDRFVARQVVGHLESNNLLPDRQSAYQPKLLMCSLVTLVDIFVRL